MRENGYYWVQINDPGFGSDWIISYYVNGHWYVTGNDLSFKDDYWKKIGEMIPRKDKSSD